MGELMTDMFTMDISSDGNTLAGEFGQNHSKLHALLNTPIILDQRKKWYAKMSSIEISKNVDTVICSPHVKKELNIRVGKMDQCPHTVNPYIGVNIPVTWIGESCVSFDFNTDHQTPTPSFTSATNVVDFLEYNPSYNRVKLLSDKNLLARGESLVLKPILLKRYDHKILKHFYGAKYIKATVQRNIPKHRSPPVTPTQSPPTSPLENNYLPPLKKPSTTHLKKKAKERKFTENTIEKQSIYTSPPTKIETIYPDLKNIVNKRKIVEKNIRKQQPWNHVKKVIEKKDLPDRYFSLTDVLEVKVMDGKLVFSVIPSNTYGVNYAVIRAPTELSYIFGFPYEFSSNKPITADPWYFADGSERWRIKACGVYGDTKPWDIWGDKNIKAHHFNEICNPLYELNNVKVITDFTEVPLTESKPVINILPLGAWISDPATKYYHMCVKSINNHEWRCVIKPGGCSICNMKIYLESTSGYPLRILGRGKATRISISFLPL